MNVSSAVSKVVALERSHVNPTKHKTVKQIFSSQQYADVADRHSKDIELYYWGVQQARALTECFGGKEWPAQAQLAQALRQRPLQPSQDTMPHALMGLLGKNYNVTVDIDDWWDDDV